MLSSISSHPSFYVTSCIKGENYVYLTGSIVVRYKISGKEIEIDALKMIWSCIGEDGKEEYFEDELAYDSRGYEIHHPKPK